MSGLGVFVRRASMVVWPVSGQPASCRHCLLMGPVTMAWAWPLYAHLQCLFDEGHGLAAAFGAGLAEADPAALAGLHHIRLGLGQPGGKSARGEQKLAAHKLQVTGLVAPP